MKKALIAIWAVLWVSNFYLPSYYESHFQPPEERRRRLDVLLDVLGESRTLLARYLWFKADLYHEISDSRGVNFLQEKDVIPLHRLITYLDPHLEDAFDILATDMMMGYNDRERAYEVLQEGIGYNPKSFQLQFRRAFLLHHEKRYQECVPEAEKALERAKDEFDILNSCRLLFSCYDKLGGHDEDALRVLDLWLHERPKDDKPLSEKAKILKRLGRTK